MVQLAKSPTLKFGAGLDLRVLIWNPAMNSILGMELLKQTNKQNF